MQKATIKCGRLHRESGTRIRSRRFARAFTRSDGRSQKTKQPPPSRLRWQFRHLASQVRDMSELDKIMHFLRGLDNRSKEEVQYRRCTTLTEAITVALDFRWSQPV